MKSLDMISVVIPAYNVEKYLARCLDSVCRQSYEKLEIIVVDDGSVDKTPSICDEYARRDGRIRVIHKKNAGVASARNDALDMIKGNLVAFADADDHYEPEMIETLYMALMEKDADMVSCGYYEEYPDRIDEHGTGSGTIVYDRTEAYEDYFRMGGRIGSGCWNKLIKVDAIGSVRFKNYRMGEDVEFLCRIIDRCNRIVCVDYAGYHYIHREGSATRLEFSSTNLDILYVSDEMLEYTRKHHPELTRQMYAFHAAWYSAQIQVMYWQKDTSKYVKEKKYIRNNLKMNVKEYRGNPFVAKADMLFIESYLLGCYRPVKMIYDGFNILKKKKDAVRLIWEQKQR